MPALRWSRGLKKLLLVEPKSWFGAFVSVAIGLAMLHERPAEGPGGGGGERDQAGERTVFCPVEKRGVCLP